MGAAPAVTISSGTDEAKSQILNRYEQRIQYYWKASRSNKNSYKLTRYAVVVLGALVTLDSTLSSVKLQNPWGVVFAISTPALAFLLTVVGGVSQAFQWGAAWSDMVITATRLETERDRVAVTPSSQLDAAKEMALLNDTVLAETQGFFQRLLGSGGPVKADGKTGG